jgi:hypothetical protein
MAFQIKDFASIAASMVNWMKSATKKVTDFNVGSVVRTIVEAVAIEIDELYQQMFIGLKEAIPVATYNSFSFERIGAKPASGMLRVTITSSATDTFIPAGTVFKANEGGQTYISTLDVTIDAGDTFADIYVVAEVPGSAGNQLPGQTFSLTPAVAIMVSATNLSAWRSGSDLETDEERKMRFIEFIASLARGTVRALEYGLKLTVLSDAAGNETERVVKVKVIEPWIASPGSFPISLVNCYIHNGSGSTSVALVNRAKEIIYGYLDEDGVSIAGWKAAGVQVEVYAAAEQAVNVTAALTALPGYVEADLIDQAEEIVYTYLIDLAIGEPAIRSEMIALVMELDGVYNFIPSVPAGDTTPAENVKLMPGTIAIT